MPLHYFLNNIYIKDSLLWFNCTLATPSIDWYIAHSNQRVVEGERCCYSAVVPDLAHQFTIIFSIILLMIGWMSVDASVDTGNNIDTSIHPHKLTSTHSDSDRQLRLH